MPIDPNIALSYRPPQFESPLNAMLQIQTLKRSQQEDRLNELQMREYQRKQQQQLALQNALMSGASLEDVARQTGDVSILQADAQIKAAQARVGSSQATADKARQTAAMDLLARAGIESQEDLDHLKSVVPPEVLPYLPATYRPGLGISQADRTKLAETKRYHDASLGGVKTSTTDAQGNVHHFDRNAVQIGVTPGAGKPTKPTIVTDRAGNVTVLGPDMKPTSTLPGAGKPSAGYDKEQSDRKKLMMDLDRAITELESATKDGGLIDRSTGSGAGALMDASAAFFGNATPGAIAVGEMQPIYDLVLKMVPRFEGPQSDKDTQSYREAAGQLANPAIPVPKKKAAALTILRLMKDRKGQFTTSETREPLSPGSAPPEAIEYLKSHPELADQFKTKYGYLP